IWIKEAPFRGFLFSFLIKLGIFHAYRPTKILFCQKECSIGKCRIVLLSKEDTFMRRWYEDFSFFLQAVYDKICCRVIGVCCIYIFQSYTIFKLPNTIVFQLIPSVTCCYIAAMFICLTSNILYGILWFHIVGGNRLSFVVLAS